MNTPWSDAAPAFYDMDDPARKAWEAKLSGYYRDSQRLDWLLKHNADFLLCIYSRADIDHFMLGEP